jgi:hypothetical protein
MLPGYERYGTVLGFPELRFSFGHGRKDLTAEFLNSLSKELRSHALLNRLGRACRAG